MNILISSGQGATSDSEYNMAEFAYWNQYFYEETLFGVFSKMRLANLSVFATFTFNQTCDMFELLSKS